MITKYKIFEGIRWYKGGRLSDEEEYAPLDETKFKVGDYVEGNYNQRSVVYYWNTRGNRSFKKDEDFIGDYHWEPHLNDIERKVEEIGYVNNVDGYTGQVMKLYGAWPWWQTTNFRKIEHESPF